ncbi:hypothetical protein HN51_001285, partial [Arachis hypogaea]
LIKGRGTMLKKTTTIKDGTKATHLLNTIINFLPNTTIPTKPTKITIINHTNTHNKIKLTTIDTNHLTRDNKPINLLPLSQIKVAAAINEWRFSKLKEYKDRSIEAENEALDQYMQNVGLLEEVLSVKSLDDSEPSAAEPNPLVMEDEIESD